MDIEVIVAILGSSLLTSVANGFLGKRRNSVEIEDKINEMATRLMDEQRGEINRLTERIIVLGDKYDTLKEENKALKQKLEKCTNAEDIDKLEKRVRGLGG